MIIPAPISYRVKFGKPENYFIHDGYACRPNAKQFDDRGFTDEFQKEVYQYARQVADTHGLKRIADVGCGSAYKLVTNFLSFETLGIDRPEIVAFLRERMPNRPWLETDFSKRPAFDADLIICADVIEHLLDPEGLLLFIRNWKPKRIVLSTPERDELCLGTHDGPPRNGHHVREWNWIEFNAFVSQFLFIQQHFVINAVQIVEATV